MARLREAEGDLDGALALLDEAERCYVGDFSPDVRPVPAVRARVLRWRRAQCASALDWVRERGTVRRRRPHLPARVRAHHPRPGAPGPVRRSERDERSIREAVALLERLLVSRRGRREDGQPASRSWWCRRWRSEARGDIAAALASLERALTLAEPEGYVRIFVDEGAPMAVAAEGRREARRAGQLRASPAGRLRRTRRQPRPSAGPGRPAERARARRAAAARHPTWTGRTSPASSFVSLNTVRTHTKNIYAKLGVNNRRAAVRRADELELLARPDSDDHHLRITTHGDPRSSHPLLPFARSSGRR